MDNSFWWGLGASVPVGLAVNLATPKVQGWYSRFNNQAALRRTKEAEEYGRLGLFYNDHPIVYQTFLHRNQVAISIRFLLCIYVIGVATISSAYIVGYPAIFTLLLLIVAATQLIVTAALKWRHGTRVTRNVIEAAKAEERSAKGETETYWPPLDPP